MFFDVFPNYAAQVEVALPEYEGFHNSSEIENPVYSGVRFGSDGKIYRNTTAGDWQWTGLSWLIAGAASAYYLKWSLTSGSALANEETNLSQMNANLDFNVTSGFIRKTTDLLFTICDDTLGASELVSRTYQLDAERPVDIEQGAESERPRWVQIQ